MLDNGFLPDAISSDVHCLSIEGPAYDQLVTLSKFLHLGMDIPEIIRATTEGPARAISKPELGSLKPGTIGDATLLRVIDDKVTYVDSLGETRDGNQRFSLAGVVLDGKWWDDGEAL